MSHKKHHPFHVLGQMYRDWRLPGRMIYENREGHSEYAIPRDFFCNREPGVSAFIRLKDEAEWIVPCLQSICGVFDEIIAVFQNCTDNTEALVESLDLPNVRSFHYPFDSFPNGPGHDRYPADSIRHKAYYYNWCLAKTTRQWACKWDGDMVAMDWLGDEVRRLMPEHDIITVQGVDIVGPELRHVGRHPLTAREPRFFRVDRDTFYQGGPLCETFSFPRRSHRRVLPGSTARLVNIEAPAFLHFKWAKSLESAAKAWPENWREFPDVARHITAHAKPVSEYSGEYPKAVLEKLAREEGKIEKKNAFSPWFSEM